MGEIIALTITKHIITFSNPSRDPPQPHACACSRVWSCEVCVFS